MLSGVRKQQWVVEERWKRLRQGEAQLRPALGLVLCHRDLLLPLVSASSSSLYHREDRFGYLLRHDAVARVGVRAALEEQIGYVVAQWGRREVQLECAVNPRVARRRGASAWPNNRALTKIARVMQARQVRRCPLRWRHWTEEWDWNDRRNKRVSA